MGEKRNIILVTADSVRADHCSFMGYNRKTTPNLDKMAKNGLCFENAYAPASRTLSSMISFFTGDLITQYNNCTSEEKFGKNGRLNLKRKKTLAKALAERGYTTGAFNPNAYASRYFGFDKGFSYFQDFLFDTSTFDKYIKGGKSMQIIRNFKNLLTKSEVFKTWEKYYEEITNWIRNAEEPFFLWVFLLDTHFPYFVPRKYKKWGSLLDMYRVNYKLYNTISKLNVDFPEEDVRKAVDSYDDSIYYADKFFSRLVEDTKEYDPLIIFHSDHGEGFFERGFYGHFFPFLYEEVIKVPLIIYNGGVKGNVKSLVSTLDLYPAILKFADTGEINSSLGSKDRTWVISKDIDFRNGGKEVFSVRLGDWKFITGQNETNELYNFKEDQYERSNLVNKHLSLVAELRGIIDDRSRRELETKKIKNKVANIKG